MLDHDDRVASIDQTVQLLHQLRDVRRMQAGGWFGEHVERLSAVCPLRFGGKLYALRFAAGEFGGRLPEEDVSETDLAEYAKGPPQGAVVGEELERLVDSHAQHICDGPLSDLDLERLGIIPRAFACWTRRVHAWKEQEFDADEFFTLAGLTPAFGNVA